MGEDLGTVADDVRLRLSERKILSYRLVWFEEETRIIIHRWRWPR